MPVTKSLSAMALSLAISATTLGLIAAPANAEAPPANLTSSVVDNTPLFSWEAVPGASAYKIDISSDANFQNILETANSYSPIYKTRKSLANGEARTIYWRVASYSSGTSSNSLSAYSSVQQVHLDAQGSPVPNEINSPVNYPTGLNFKWDAVAGATQYELQYSASDSFPSADTRSVTVAGLAYSPSESVPAGEWHWRVRALLFTKDSVNSTVDEVSYTPWSAPQSVDVGWLPTDSTVQRNTPAASAMGQPGVSDPLFSWDPVEGARYYTIAIARDNAMTNHLVNPTVVFGTNFVPNQTLLNGEVWWTVTAHDISGNPGAPSEPRRYIQQWGSQAGPNQVNGETNIVKPLVTNSQGSSNPASPAVIPLNQLNFSWDPVPRATYYEVTLKTINGETVGTCKTANTSVNTITKFSKGNQHSNLTAGDGNCLTGFYTNTSSITSKYLDNPGEEPQRTVGLVWRVRAINLNATANTSIQTGLPADTLVSEESDPRYIVLEKSETNDFGDGIVEPDGILELNTSDFNSQVDLNSAPAPVFHWEHIPEAVGYEVRLYRGSNTNHVASYRTIGNKLRINGVLKDDNTNTSYWLRVRALSSGLAADSYVGYTDWDSLPYVEWTRTTSTLELNQPIDKDGQILLSWSPQFSKDPLAGGNRGYLLEYKTSAQTWAQAKTAKLEYPQWIAQSTNTSGAPTGVPLANGDYSYRVKAMDANGGTNGNWSDEGSFTVGVNTPTNLQAVNHKNNSVIFTWDATPQANGYQVQYKRDNGTWQDVNPANAPWGQNSVVAHPSAGDWSFRVRARSEGNNWSDWSAEKPYTVAALPVQLTTPGNAVLSSSNRKLSWNAVPNASRYIVQMATSAGAVSTASPVEVVGTEFTPTENVSWGTTYYYKVTALGSYWGNISGNTWTRQVLGESEVRSVGFRTPPGKVSNPSGEKSGAGNLTIKWTPLVGNDTGTNQNVWYRVQYRERGVSPVPEWSQSQDTSANASELTLTGLKLNTEYEFRVVAVNGEGQGAWSGIARSTTASAPSTVRSVRTKDVKENSLTLTWQVPSDNGGLNISQYVVKWTEAGKSDWSSRNTTELTQTLSGLRQGTKYQIEVSARNGAGQGPVAAIEVTTAGKKLSLKAPQKPKAVSKRGAVTVSWGAPRGDQPRNYTLEVNGGKYNTWTTVGTTSTRSYIHRNIVSGEVYTYRVRGNGSGGETSPYSAETTVRTGLPGKPVVKLKQKGKKKKKKVVISWSAADANGSAITRYTVRTSKNGKKWTTKTVKGSKRKLTVKVGKKQKKLVVRVKAINSFGTGPNSAKKKIKLK